MPLTVRCFEILIGIDLASIAQRDNQELWRKGVIALDRLAPILNIHTGVGIEVLRVLWLSRGQMTKRAKADRDENTEDNSKLKGTIDALGT
ncbi:hypothetical protein ACEN2J_08430 [Pseudorhodobacter sp. W20_MBD10_FR17]